MLACSFAPTPAPDRSRRLALASSASLPGQHWLWRGQKIYYVRAEARSSLGSPAPTGSSPADRPAFLLVHGFGASTDHWRKNIADLSQDFDVFAIDLLGFGRSAKPAWVYSGDLWRDQLADFVREIVGRPVFVAGNSLGGYACLCLGAERPEWVRGVALLNSAGPFAPKEPSPSQPTWSADLRAKLRELSRLVLLHPWTTYLLFQRARQKATIRKTLEKVYLDQTAVTDRLVDEIYQPSCDPGAVQVFGSVFKSPQGKTLDQLLAELTCSLVLIWGEADPWIRAQERSRQFKSHYPGAIEHFLAAGHCPHDEAPEQVNAILRDWAQQLT